MEFSVPYNGDINLIGQLAELREHNGSRIREIFLSGPQEHGSSGRIAHNGTFDQFCDAVAMMHDAGFRVNLVMNSTCEGIMEYSDGYAEAMRDYVDSADPPPYLKNGNKVMLEKAALAPYFKERQEVK